MRSAALGSQTRLGIEHSYPPMAPLEWLHVRSNGFRGAVRRDILPGFSHTEAITQTVEHLIRSTQGTGVASEEMSFILSVFFSFCISALGMYEIHMQIGSRRWGLWGLDAMQARAGVRC